VMTGRGVGWGVDCAIFTLPHTVLGPDDFFFRPMSTHVNLTRTADIPQLASLLAPNYELWIVSEL
jgi:hypothetical protein